jgi:hypothetical protein
MRDDTRASIHQLTVMAAVLMAMRQQGTVRTDVARFIHPCELAQTTCRAFNAPALITALGRIHGYFPNLGAVSRTGTSFSPSSYYQAHLQWCSQEAAMDTNTLLILLIALVILGGGGYYGRGRWF